MNTTNALAVIITTLRAIAESTYALAADHVGALKLLRELRNSGVAPGCATDEWIRATRLNYIRYCSPEPYHSARLTEQLAAVRVAIEEGLAISEADVEVPAADDEEYPAAFLAAVEAVLAMPDAAVLGGDGVGGVRCALWGETRRLTHEPFGSLGATARTWADQYSSWSRAPLDDAKADDDLREATEALRAAYVAYREQHAVARGPNDLLEQLDAERAARLVAEQGLAEIRKVLGANDDDDGDGEYESTHAAARRAIEVRNVWQTRWNEAADKLGAVRNALGASLSDDIVGKARHLTERLALAERKAQDLDETRAVLGVGPNESVAGAARCLVNYNAELVKERHEVRATLAAAEGESAVEAAKRQVGKAALLESIVASREAEILKIRGILLGGGPGGSPEHAAREAVEKIAQLRATMADQTSAYEAGAAQHGERYKELERELKHARNQAAAAEMAADQALAHVRADHEATLADRDRKIDSLSARLTNHQHVIARVASVLGATPGESPEAAARRMAAALADRDRRIERLCALMDHQGSMCKALEAQANTITPELASAIVDALAGPFTVGSLFGMPRADVIATILALRPVEVRVEEDFWDTPISTPEARLRGMRGMHDTLADWTIALRPVEVHVEEDRRDTPIGATPPRPRPTWKALADAVKAYLDVWDGESLGLDAARQALAREVESRDYCISKYCSVADEDRDLRSAARKLVVGIHGIDPLRRALADWTLALAASNKENP